MMTFPKDCDHIILMGGSPLLVEVAKMLRAAEYQLEIYTAPRQEAEMMPSGKTLGQSLTKAGFDWYVVADDINHTLSPSAIGPTTIGIGLGEAWQFGKPLLDAFNGRLLDFMGIPLPRYRGGAHYSWAILNQEMDWGCALQEVTPNTVQGEKDDGAIICQRAYEISHLAITPADWFEECVRVEADFIGEFFLNVRKGVVFQPAMPDERKSLFFPRLKTTEHGWINWSWSGAEIADFINAFDAPYPGARTTLDGNVVSLQGAEFFNGDDFHPFAAGLIVRVDKSYVVVATRTGSLHIDRVHGVEKLQAGQRFFTSTERLERALTYTPQYTATGDGVKPGTNIVGKLVTLRPLTLADVNETYVGWMNDPAIKLFLESRQKQTMDGLRSWVRRMTQSETDYPFAIIETASNRHVGNIKIGSIDWFHKNADIGYIIGAKDCWGKGYATEAIRLATDYAINKLGLYHIRAGVMEENVASIKALRKAGYAFEGIWSNQLFDGTKRTGHAWLSTTADAWQGVPV